MSVVYSLKTRLEAARSVLAAKGLDAQEKALNHWGVFFDSFLPSCPAAECRVEYIEKMFSTLREEVVVWYLFHLEERIDEVETPDFGRLGPHR